MSTPVLTSRDLLAAIGIGHFNATMMIPYLMIAPATTDPKMPPVIMIVTQLQKALYELGAIDVPNSGRLDQATALAIEQVVGPNWERAPWSASIAAVVRARDAGTRIAPSTGAPVDGVPMAVGGPLDFLPDIPGGLITYGVLGYLLYRHMAKR